MPVIPGDDAALARVYQKAVRARVRAKGVYTPVVVSLLQQLEGSAWFHGDVLMGVAEYESALLQDHWPARPDARVCLLEWICEHTDNAARVVLEIAKLRFEGRREDEEAGREALDMCAKAAGIAKVCMSCLDISFV